MLADATLDHLERDEAFDIGTELGEIFSPRAGVVLLQRTIDDALRQGGVERPARAVGHEDERVVPPLHPPPATPPAPASPATGGCLLSGPAPRRLIEEAPVPQRSPELRSGCLFPRSDYSTDRTFVVPVPQGFASPSITCAPALGTHRSTRRVAPR